MLLRSLEDVFDGVEFRISPDFETRVSSDHGGGGSAGEFSAADLLGRFDDGPATISSLGEDEMTVAALVLDGVLEARFESDFVCGPEASEPLLDRDASEPKTTLAELSERAVRVGASTSAVGVLETTKLLYRYNTVPVSRATGAGAHASSRALLGLDDPDISRRLGAMRPALSAGGDDTPWLSWSDPSAHRANYKLYVSPRPDATPDAFRAVVREAADAPAPFMKIGANIYNLLRPDKFVLYYPSLHQLRAAAPRLEAALSGLPAQGVPFTAQLSADGLLSWGVDHVAVKAQGQSWRIWVSRRLALALETYRARPAAIEAWRFALLRLAMDGVDMSSWELHDSGSAGSRW